MSKKVLVIGEAREGSLRNVTFEAIAAANIVSDGGEVVGVLCGDGELKEMAQEMVYYGAARVITVSNPELKTYTSDGYAQAVHQVIEDESPEGIIMGPYGDWEGLNTEACQQAGVRTDFRCYGSDSRKRRHRLHTADLFR